MASLIEVHNPVLIASDNIELKILIQNITDDINVLEFKKKHAKYVRYDFTVVKNIATSGTLPDGH